MEGGLLRVTIVCLLFLSARASVVTAPTWARNSACCINGIAIAATTAITATVISNSSREKPACLLACLSMICCTPAAPEVELLRIAAVTPLLGVDRRPDDLTPKPRFGRGRNQTLRAIRGGRCEWDAPHDLVIVIGMTKSAISRREPYETVAARGRSASARATRSVRSGSDRARSG